MPGKQAKVVTPPMLKRMLRHVSRSSFPVRDRAMILLSMKADQIHFPRPSDEGRMTSFEFHLTAWLGGSGGGDRPVLPEVAKLRGRPLLCLYGQEETDSLCTEIGGLGKAVALQGSHHFGGDYAALADRILREAQPAAARK